MHRAARQGLLQFRYQADLAEVELPELGPAPFWEQRRLPVTVGGGFAGDNSPRRVIQGLLPGTPREMPVPYKELGVKGEPLYTWGGTTPNSPKP